MTGTNTVQDGINPSSVTAVISVTGVDGTPPGVKALHARLKAGDFADRPELRSELAQLFSARPADATQRARLLELAREVRTT